MVLVKVSYQSQIITIPVIDRLALRAVGGPLAGAYQGAWETGLFTFVKNLATLKG
jgi:hypothetical protein